MLRPNRKAPQFATARRRQEHNLRGDVLKLPFFDRALSFDTRITRLLALGRTYAHQSGYSKKPDSAAGDGAKAREVPY